MFKINDNLIDSKGFEWSVVMIIPPEHPLGDGEGGENYIMLSRNYGVQLLTESSVLKCFEKKFDIGEGWIQYG